MTENLPKLEIIAEAVLVCLFRASTKSDGFLTSGKLSEQLKSKISTRQVDLSLQILAEKGLANSGNNRCWITKEGYQYIERDLDTPNTFASQFSDGEVEWLFETGGKTNNPPEEEGLDRNAPASDRIVPLDHNSAGYKDATTKLEEVISATEADRTNDFEEKEQILAELNAGKTLLKSASVRASAIAAVLGSALLFLAKLFAEKAIGEMASTAWAAIKTLIGL